jgi:DNA polymerase-3 subunit alpha
VEKQFVHLHVHSHFSLLDGLSRPEDIAREAKRQNAPAVAITDHGTMYGVVEFFKACKKEGIKPIIGCECFVANRSLHDKEAGIDNKRHHLVLLAKNQKGYQNLVKMVTTAYLEGLYYKPRIDFELLKKHSEGIICLSACIAGEVPNNYINHGLDEAKKSALKFKDLFKDDFYLEVQYHPGIPDQAKANEGVIQISKELDIPLVATNDSHYPLKEDADVHDTLLCIQTNAQKDEKERMCMLDSDFSLRTPEEMYEVFSHVPEACENTVKIAEKCDFEFTFGVNHLPNYPTEDGSDDKTYLRRKCEEGIKNRFNFDPKNPQTDKEKEIVDRLELELGVINDMGFPSYFLIVWDFVKWAKDQGIAVGPGRGSAAGSLISYVLEITNLDPIEHELFFERFLNPERVSMPDIDLDFADDKRDEVIRYVSEKYGKNRVAQICTFGTMAARAAIKDVGRAFGIPFTEMNEFAKLIPDKPGTTLEEALEMSKELVDDIESNSVHKKIFETARKLEGSVRHVSVHACAVVIAPDDLMNYTPLQYPPKDDSIIITQFSAKPIEALGLLKMDFLGLKNLTIMDKARKIIKRTHGVDIDLDTIPMNDAKSFELLTRGETTGVFQLESDGMKKYLRELRPTNFEDIIAMVSLYRPGPMQFIPDYIKGKHGLKEVKYVDKSLKPVLEKTYGIAIYQEQILKIAQVLAGFTLGQADILRRAIGKKIPEELASQRRKFIDGAVEKGHSEQMAIDVFDKVIEPFAGYGFNRSHAACYAMIAYQTAYLKANYPTEFMSALLSCDSGNTDRVKKDIEECDVLEIKILPPSVNESLKNFTVSGEKEIRFGLSAIKGIGDSVVNDIINTRKADKFKDFEDFVTRLPQKSVNKKALEALAKSSAIKEFINNPHAILENIEEITGFAKRNAEPKETNQIGLFADEVVDEYKPKMTLKDVKKATRMEALNYEKETLGLYVSDHPLKGMDNYFAGKGRLIAELHEKGKKDEPVEIGGMVTSFRKIITRNNTTMAVVQLEDPTDKIDVVLFPKIYEKYSNILEGAEIMKIKGKYDKRDEQVQVIAMSVDTAKFEEVRIASKRMPQIERQFEKKEKAPSMWTIDIPKGINKKDLQRVNEVLTKSTGSCFVEIKIGEKTFPFHHKIEFSENLQGKIYAILKK